MQYDPLPLRVRLVRLLGRDWFRRRPVVSFSKLDHYRGSLESVVRCYITLLLRNIYDVSQVIRFRRIRCHRVC